MKQENVFLFEFNLDLSYRKYQNVYVDITRDIICADAVYPFVKKLSLFTYFATIKDFLDVYNNNVHNTKSFLQF